MHSAPRTLNFISPLTTAIRQPEIGSHQARLFTLINLFFFQFPSVCLRSVRKICVISLIFQDAPQKLCHLFAWNENLQRTASTLIKFLPVTGGFPARPPWHLCIFCRLEASVTAATLLISFLKDFPQSELLEMSLDQWFSTGAVLLLFPENNTSSWEASFGWHNWKESYRHLVLW